MPIGRNDASDGPKERPTGDDAPGRPPIDPSGAPPTFDWSKVRGGKESKAKKRKKKELEEEQAPDSGALPKLSRWAPNLTRNEQYLAGGVVVLLIGILYFAFFRAEPGLRNSLSASEAKQFEEKAQKEMIDSFDTLYKTYGPDHPEVKQQREMLRQMGLKPK